MIAGVTSPYTHTPLINTVTYFYVVTVVRGPDESPDSPEVSDTPIAGLPGIPQNVIAVGTDGNVSITWDPVGIATSYTVYMGTVPGVTPANFGALDTTWGMEHPNQMTESFTHPSPLPNGTTFYFVVTAVNGTGESPESVEVNATPNVPSGSLWDTMIWDTDLWQ